MTSGVLLHLPTGRKKLRYESALRVAAATLKHALAGDVSATKVVGRLGREEDADRLRLLASAVSDEFGLEAQLALNGTSFSVRFTVPD